MEDGLVRELLGAGSAVPKLFLQDIAQNHTIQRQHIRSYETLVRLLLDIVRENGKRTATSYEREREITVELSDPKFETPQIIEQTGVVRPILPRECRERGLTYEAPLVVTVTLRDSRLVPLTDSDPDFVPGGPARQFRREMRGRPQELRCAIPTYFPVMVGSRYCNLSRDPDRRGECSVDMGGYFIIGGYERIVQILKNPRPSNPVITVSRSGKYELECEIRSDHPTRSRNTSTMKVVLTSDRPVRILVVVPYIQTPLSLPVVLKLVGFETAEAVRGVLFPEGRFAEGTFAGRVQEIVERDLDDPLFALPRREMMQRIGEDSGEPAASAVQYAYHQQSTEFLPQCGYSDAASPEIVHMSKALVLRQVARRLAATHLDRRRFPPDNRDHMANKYFQLCHVSLSIMFRQMFAEYMDMLRKRMYLAITKSRPVNLNDDVHRPDPLYKSIRTAFTRGDITVKKAQSDTASGVIQLLLGQNKLALAQHPGRVNTPTSRDGKCAEIREYHPSSTPFEDIPYTPEGHEVGLIGALAMGTRVRIASPATAVPCFLEKIPGFEPLAGTVEQLAHHGRSTLVFVNGNVVGFASDRVSFCARAREFRRGGVLPVDATVANRLDGVHVDVSDGVPVFPCLRASEVGRIRDVLPELGYCGKGLLSLCLRHGIVEYLSPEEILEFHVVETVDD
jgi:DNA-directed RNA polymerase beta subunit